MPTFAQWGERWLAMREAEPRRSIATLRSHWRCHLVEAPFADAPLDRIKRSEVRAFAHDRSLRRARRSHPAGSERRTVDTERALSPTTVRHVVQSLHAVFAAAVEEDLIAHNPATNLRLRLGAPATRWDWLSRDEVERIASSTVLPEEQRAILLTAIYTGLRKGELWALRWSDVFLDDEHPRVVIARSFTAPPKSGRSELVPLIPRAKRVLNDWRSLTRRATELVFAHQLGARHGLMRGRSTTAGWADGWSHGRRRAGWRRRLGIARRVRFHDLRHTAATHLLSGTWGRAWSLAEVRDFLRHRSIRDTERYAHFATGSLFDAARDTRG